MSKYIHTSMMCVYIHIFAHIYTHIHTIGVCVCVHIYTYMHMLIYVCMHTHPYTRALTCVKCKLVLNWRLGRLGCTS